MTSDSVKLGRIWAAAIVAIFAITSVTVILTVGVQ